MQAAGSVKVNTAGSTKKNGRHEGRKTRRPEGQKARRYFRELREVSPKDRVKP
jgi:hypothetical protein